MASSGILSIISTALGIAAVMSDFVKLECKSKYVGYHDQQSLLNCVVQTTKDVKDPTIHVVAWKKLTSPGAEDGPVVLAFAKGNLDKPKPGYRFAEPSWDEKNMNVSLLITNTAVADEGYYKCTVITDSGDNSMVTSLKVQAKYSTPTVHSDPEKIVPNADSTLICKSHGGYPKGTLRWFDEEHHEWTKSSEVEAKQTNNGLFQLTSKLLLLGGSTFPKYTCVVFNASGDKEDEIMFEIPRSAEIGNDRVSAEASKIAAPLVVIGSLIIGLLCALLLYRRRSQQTRRDSTAPLMDGHHMVHAPKGDDVETAGDQSSEEDQSEPMS